MNVDFEIIDFLKEKVFDKIRPAGNITNIVDNSNGTYTFTFDSDDEFDTSFTPEIFNATGFNGIYRIENLTATTFDIVKIYTEDFGFKDIDSGISIPLLDDSTFVMTSPFFVYGEQRLINALSKGVAGFPQIYPLAILLPFDEDIQELNKQGITDNQYRFDIWFVEPTDKTCTGDWYNFSNYFDQMRKLKKIALNFVSYLRNAYDKDLNIVISEEPLSAKLIRRADGVVFDFVPIGVSLSINYKVNSAYNICRPVE